MRVVAGIAGVALIALMLSEFFVAFMLPRRVRRDPRIARNINRLLWRPWRALARRLPANTADTMLGLFGPLALVSQLVTWTIGLLVGYALLERELRSWEEWAAELMETQLSYPLLGFYRSQHVNQNWLAALTAMVDVAAFVKATAL